MNESFRNSIRRKIGEGKLEVAIKDLILNYKETHHHNFYLLQESRLNDLNIRINQGIEINADEKRNQIKLSILDYISKIEQRYNPFVVNHTLQYFTGRESELRHLEGVFFNNKKNTSVIYSITGLGGIGKSVLALHFSQLYRDRFPDGIFWITVDESTPLSAARKISVALNKENEILKKFYKKGSHQFRVESEYAQGLLSRWLNGKKALLVLDNADNKEIENIIRYFIPDGNSISILITTRNRWLPQHLNTEYLNLECFKVNDGLELFKKIFNNNQRFEQESEELKKLILFFGGLPLVLDLAAKAIKNYYSYSTLIYLEEIKQTGNILNPQKYEAKIDACLNKSLSFLNEQEQMDFIYLGACLQSGFSIETARSILGKPDVISAKNFLFHLYDLSLIQRESFNRFRLHPIINSFVKKQKKFNGAELRHAQHWLRFSKKYQRDLTEDWKKISIEIDSIFSAWNWCQETIGKEDSEIYLKLVSEFAVILRYFLDGEGYWQEFFHRYPKALEAIKKLDDNEENKEIQYKIRRHFAIIVRKSGELKRAIKLNEENIKFSKKNKNRKWIILEKEQLARAYVRLKKYDKAERILLDAKEEVLDLRYKAQFHNSLGGLNRRRGEYNKAITYFEHSLEIYLELEDKQGIGSTLCHLGHTFLKIKDYRSCTLKLAKGIANYYDDIKIEVKGSAFQTLGYALEKIGNLKMALASYILSTDICEKLNISGWEGIQPIEERNRLFKRLDKEVIEWRDIKNEGVKDTIENEVKLFCISIS